MNSNVTKRTLVVVPLLIFVLFTILYGWLNDLKVEARMTRIEAILDRTALMKQETAAQIARFEPQNEQLVKDLDALAGTVRDLSDSLKQEQRIRATLHPKAVRTRAKRTPVKTAKTCLTETEKRTPFGNTFLIERVLVPVECK